MQKRTAEVEVNNGVKMHADMWIASDQFDELSQLFEPEGSETSEQIANRYLGNSASQIFSTLTTEEKEYIYLWGEHIKRPRLGCLAAHGDDEHGKWTYYDGKRKLHVQSWLNAYDGHYAALLCLCCNTASLTPQTKHSLVVLPDMEYSKELVIIGECTVSIVHPYIGELNQYVIEYELEKLRAQLQPQV